MTYQNNSTDTDRWAGILKAAIEQPGLVLSAYTNFHNYSIGNQLAAMLQCHLRGIQPGPIATYPRWQQLGRQVRRGEKAIELCMPITVKHDTEEDEPETFTRFLWKKNWFVLSQTDGEPVAPEPIPDWDDARALEALKISKVPFDYTNGNVQGFARKRQIAISPLAALPQKTAFHEIAHILLGHTEEGDVNDGETIPRSLREAEAESVAMICCESLGIDGAPYCRGYIQGWLEGAPIPERSAQRIFKAADQILKAGRPAEKGAPHV